jgi:hypothetical protein
MSRLEWTTEGRPKLAYTAIDPAQQLFSCKCGKPTCVLGRLRPFRDHIRRLYRAIAVATELQHLPRISDSEEGWQATLFSLQMAASVEDAFADTSYVDDSEAIFWCSSAWDSEVLSSEIAAKYVAGLTIFNFLWAAYEATVKAATQDQFVGERTAVRGRRLAEKLSGLESEMPLLSKVYRIAVCAWRRGRDLDTEIDAIGGKYGLSGLAAAAELCRVYRNHVAHGDDIVPSAQSDWDENGWGDANFVVYRLYGVGRLLLTLIQAFAYHNLANPAALMPVSLNPRDASELDGKRVFLQLQIVDEGRGRVHSGDEAADLGE